MKKHRIIIIEQSDTDKANEACANLYGEAARNTFTIELLDETDTVTHSWCGWRLSDQEWVELLDEFEKQGIDPARVSVYDDARPAEVLEKNNLHLPEKEER